MAQFNEEDRKWLFDTMKAKGVDTGSYDEFAKSLGNKADREWYYQKGIEFGLDLGSQQDFDDMMYDRGSALQGSLQQRMYPNGVKPDKPIVAQQEQPVQQQPQATKQTYKPTDMERMAMGMTLGNAQYAVDNATKGIDQIEQNAKKASPFGGGNAGLGNNGNLRKGKQTFDAEKGAFVDTYLTSDGREFRDIQQANNVQGNIDYNADVMRYQDTMKALGLNEINKDNVDQSLKEAYAERMELQRQLAEESKKATGNTSGAKFSLGLGGASLNPRKSAQLSDEHENLSSALRMLERRINALEAYRDDAGLVRGTTDVLTDPSSYSFGISDLADSNVMSKIKSKLDSANGDINALSDSEKAFARNYLMNRSAEQLNKDNWWYDTAGKGLGQTLSFMKDFALTGGGFASLAKGGMALGGKLGAKTATKILGNYMTKNLGTKALGKTMEYIGKGAGLALGAEAGGILLNNTVQAASSAADIANKQMGNLTVSKEGTLNFENGKSLGEAILTSQISRTGENASELVGYGFDAVPGILGRVIQRTTVGKTLKKLTENKFWKGYEKAMNYLGVQSVWGEGMEEEYNMARTEILNQLTNGQFAPEGSGLFDGERQLDTWKMVGLTSMILRVPSMIASGTDAANYYGNKYNLNTSDKNMRSVFGDDSRYNAVKSMLDGADNQKIASVLNGLMNDTNLSTEEKQAAFMYANDLINLRGFNIGNVVAAANGYQAPPKVANYNIRGLHVDEVDKDGNVLASHDYENADDLKAGLYELQQQRFDDNLQSDISIMKTRPSDQYDQFIMDYLSQANPEMLPSEFEAILAKPSLERTEEEQQLVAPFADLLHNTVYDNTMLHEDQSQQDGEELADADSIDIEEPNEDGMNLNAQWMESQGNRRMLFDQDENLGQEVELMESQGLSHQEIISRLDWARPEQVQGMIEYYNTKAKFEGYINRMAQKIDEEAVNSRQRHTFKGTIDGVADVNNVHTITDGTNRYYLVSGDVTTDPATGQITGSTSGLIIGMDLDGSFVQLNEKDGYSVEPVAMTLDQFEEAERIRLQEQMTGVIDPNQTMIPQVQQQQGGTAEGEAGANTGTGAYNPSAAASVTPAGEAAGTVQIPVDEKTGVKLYEQGVPVDQAIDDMLADGRDVNTWSDLAINEAQAELDKIKQPKTRAEAIKNEARQRELQGIIDYYNNVKARWAEMNPSVEPEQPITTATQSLGTLSVEEQKQQRIADAKAKYGELFDDDFTKANDVYELVSMWVGRKRNLAWEDVNGKRGLQKELGWTRKIGGDTKYIETLLAKNGEGVGVDEFVHMVWESPENDILGEKRFSTEEIKEALLDLLKSAGSKSDVVDYALNTRLAQAEATLQEQQKQAEIETGEPVADASGVVEELPDGGLPFSGPTNDEFTNVVNENTNQPQNDVTLQQANEEVQAVINEVSSEIQQAPNQFVNNEADLQKLKDAGVGEEFLDKIREDLADKDTIGRFIPEMGIIVYYPEKMKRLGMSQFDIKGNVYHENTHAISRLGYTKEDFAETARLIDEEFVGFVDDVKADYPDVSEEVLNEEIVSRFIGAIANLGPLEDFLNGNYKEDSPELNERINGIAKLLSNKITQNGQVSSNDVAGATGNEERQELQVQSESQLEESETEGKGQPADQQPAESAGEQVDDYLQPRNEEEEKIVATIEAQLAIDIQNQKSRVANAKKAYDKKRAEESDRATDMFSDDETRIEQGQLFGFDEMPTDRSQEGVNHRAKAEKDALDAAQAELERLQSQAEHNSRIRGALDNYRRQTTIETNDPMDAIEQAAQEFQQEREEQKPKPKSAKVEIGSDYGKNNKVVTQQEYNDLVDEWRRLHNKLNSGLATTAQLGFIMSRMAAFHIEAGARKFADFVKKMIETFDETVIPYLKSGYLAAKYLPGMEEYAKQMDSEDTVRDFDLLSYDKQNGKTVNVNKTENNETENPVSLQEKSVSEEQMKAYTLFVEQAALKLEQALTSGKKPFGSITALRQFAKECGIDVDMEGRDDILLQELVEDSIIRAGRGIVERSSGKLTQDVYDDIVKLYYMQPTISQRSSNRIKMQQYSTPLPMSFVADMFAGEGAESVLEPTAGNGMMVFAIPRETVHVNELDVTRLAVLQPQPFMKVTNQDATQPFEGDEQYDAIIANPPFGAAPAKDYDGKMISGLDEQIALNALSKMKDDGKAAIIIGGNMEYGPNGAIKSDKSFFTYLYDHYNVKGVIDMDGKLYSRQGTTYPTRMILIDGRRSEEERAQSKVYPPTLEKSAGYKVDTFDELYDLAERIKNNHKKTDGNEVLRTSTGIALPDNNDASGNTNGSGRSGQSRQDESNGGRTERGGSNRWSQTVTSEGASQRGRRGSVGVQQPGIPGLFDSQETASEPQPQTGASGERGSVSNNGRNGSADVQGSGTSNRGVGLTQPAEPVKPKVEEKRELDTDKLSYRPHNTAYSLESVAPAAMVEAMDKMLSKIEKEHGNIDAFVTRELGYDSIDDMHNALAAEQVDSVAMAIYQMKHGQGMIIGDQTGVGKGRQMAALIRWACRQGKKPVFITQKADLFSDIYRDLVDIGSGELRPFIFNSDGAMVDNNGNVVHKPLSAATQAKVFAGHELPQGYDFAVLTYSQVNTGDQISQDEAKEAAKKSGERYQKKKKENKPKATPKATFLRAIAKDNYMFLDESHTAAGKSNTGFYFQSILKTAKAVTFASATFAKRPDTMPMYALRTAMSKAKVKAEELIKIIENGGVTLQEIMSRALTEAGQMVRRERDMSDVKTDWKTVDDPTTVKKARDNYDSTIKAFNAIIDFQKNWVSPYLDRLSQDLADVAASAGMRQGTEDLGISNVPFASKTYNYTKQLMLALKVDAIVDEVVKEIEAGRHPVIALENTMGSLLSDYSPGDVIEDTTFAASLLRGLKGVLRYTIKDEDGKEQQAELSPSQLGPEGEAAYHAVEDLIRESTSGIFISPLDAITEKLQQKGYRVGELTGRNEMAVLDENTGEYKVQRRTDKDKKKLARDFNSGALDVLILNKSASTGISLHASEKFSDQRQRTMIIAQPLADINDYMQMIGRIDRTGQVARGYYINLGLPVPAEGRFLMMLSTKLKSLNANTTTSQENESNDVEAPDLLNKYGSRVVIEYLRDNPYIYVKMGEPLKQDRGKVYVGDLDNYMPQEDDARKITGYVALLPTAEQDAFYDDVVRRYTELIKYLNDTGSNDLKISVLPLRARTIDKQVSSEGADPTGSNPFAGNAYVEWVEMDVLKKPMKAAEVGKVIEQLNPEVEASKVEAKTAAQEKMLNQRMTPRVRQILDIVERETQTKLDNEQKRYEEAKAKAEKAIAEQTEKINNSKRTPEQKSEAIKKFTSDKMQAVEESHNNMVNKIDASSERIIKALKDFEVGDSYLVPDDLATDTFFGASPAIFCGFKAKDEGITPSTTLAVFCTLDGRRKVEIKLSDWSPLTRIKNHTEQNWDAAHEVTLDNWDSQVSNETRKKGFIMTGNILQAFADAGNDGRVPGQLVTYTDIDGNVHDGILMGQHWEPSQLKGSTVPIKNRMDEIKNLPNGDHITSADGNVVIERLYSIYTISVPKSKKVGGQYYKDRRLLNLVRGQDFYPNRGQLRADIEPENIEEVVNVLSDLGVQMKSDTQVQFDTESEMGQAMANGRFNPNETDPMKSIQQAASSWRRSVKDSESSLSSESKAEESGENDVPLIRRTMKSYTDRKGNYHEGIADELARLEGELGGRANSQGTGEVSGEVLVSQPKGEIRDVKDLRKRVSLLRAEIDRRNQKKEELRKKYNIDEKGNISLDDLVRMFRDLNSDKAIGKLFEKVLNVLKKLGVSFRFTDNLDTLTSGIAGSFFNATFYSWEELIRERSDQDKATDILHEMIHNVAEHILIRHKIPEHAAQFGKLTPELEKAAKEIEDIFKAVRAAKPKQKDGASPYGASFDSEMIAELSAKEFREILDAIPYKRDKNNSHRTIWQAIKEWFRNLFGVNTALDSLGDVLDNILDSYDATAIKDYRKQRKFMEQATLDEGRTGDYIDYLEAEAINGRAKIVDDPAEISRLDSEPAERGYRTVVQNSDGTFGSPMAGRLGGKKGEQSKPTSAYKMDEWERSEENPQLATDNGKINLIKPGGLGTVGNVDYNPYIHIRENKLNKQFKNAWERPDLVYIEVAYPQSELTSGYKAEKAAKSVGRHKWPGGDLILSRWDKPVRIVPWEEVADDWVREFKNRGVEFDIVSPHLLPILAERGVEILPPHKGMGEECKKAYEDFKTKTAEADPMKAIENAANLWRQRRVDDEENSPLAYSAKAVYDERLNRVETVFSEAYQDAMVSLKTAQNAIAQDKDIPDSQNAYMAENLMHGKNKNEQDLFNKMFRDPLIDTVNKIMNLTGMNWGDVDRYVYTKSGLERNREFFVRDWLERQRQTQPHSYEDLSSEEQDIYDSMAATIEQMFEDGDIESEEEKNKKLAQALQKAHQKYIDSVEDDWLRTKNERYQDLRDGTISYADYLNAITDFIVANVDIDYKPEEHDYSGFREMFGDEEGEYDEAEIIDELMDTEGMIGSENVDTLWEQINAATQYGLERYREAGMRSDEQIDSVEQMFHFYVPMRGFKDNRGEDMYQYFTGKDKAKSYVGGLLKHAKGRGSEADFPISTIFAMSYKAISDCNQNLVNQKLYRLCQANPNDLVILSDSWAVFNETTGQCEEVSPEIPEDASEDEVRETTLAWEESMQQLAMENKAKKIKGKAEFDYKPMDKKKQSEHIVDVRINGQPKKMIVTGNPRMAQALNGQLRFERGHNVFSKWNAAIKNFMASLFTSYSPTFALRNMFRDWTHFRTMLGVREGEGYAKQANKYYRQSLFKMVGLFKKYREGTLDESKEIERDFKDFMDNGGITGFVFMQKIDDIQKEMEKLYKQQKQGKAVRLNNKVWENTLGLVEAINEGIENNARFATYRASRHYAGRTKARSAYDAKGITVNFNRKGAGGKTAGFKSKNKMAEDAAKVFGVTGQVLGEGRIFFNATVQAIATTFKNFQNADGSLNKPYVAKWAAKYALPPFMFGMLLPAINKTLASAFGGDDDDDPYANLPEWTRRRNLCFYIGNDNFLTIPIGQELAAFLALGDIVAGNTYASELKPTDKGISDEMIDVMNTFSPVDISTKITKGGLMEDPVSEVIGRTFSVLAPVVAIEQNLGWTGRPIYREDKFQNDQYTPEYQMVYQSANPVLVNAMKKLHEFGGGDDVLRGKEWTEVNPAIIQYLWEQYTGGPGKVFSNTISIGKDAKDILTGNESDFNVRKVEGLKAFVSQGDDRTQYYRTLAKYNKYKKDAARLYDAVKGYEAGAAENPEYVLKLEAITKGEDFVRMQIVREADKQLSQINKAANKAEGKERKELRKLYNQQVKEVVNMLDEVGKE